VFEGGGRVQEYVGGYEDWLAQRAQAAPAPAARRVEAAASQSRSAVEGVAARAKRLSYNEQREFAALPELIDVLETEQRALGARIESPEFYKEPPDAIRGALARADQLAQEVVQAYARWDDLDRRQRS
jgi:ATP-binding cassette subfamily F protein uup